MLVGPGTTGSTQGNDTHLHGPLSRDYQLVEQSMLVVMEETDMHGLKSLSLQYCLECLVHVWSRTELHTAASNFGVDNMLRGRLDGSDDHKGTEVLIDLWFEAGMSEVGGAPGYYQRSGRAVGGRPSTMGI